PTVDNSRCRRLRSPRRSLPIGEAKQVCSLGQSKRWLFEPATISPAGGESASTPDRAYCRFAHLTAEDPILPQSPSSCQCSQSTECQLRFRIYKRRSRTRL